MKYSSILALLIAISFSVCAASRLQAQPRTTGAVQETDDEFKVTTYKRFVDLREPNPAAAYQAAKEYMAKYSREDDQYTRYLKVWIAAYEEDEKNRRLAAERADREQQLLGSFTTKDFGKAYGLAKQVLADDQDNLRVLIALGYGAFAARTAAKNEAFNNDAAGYAQRAIKLIESGKSPDTWAPFKNKEDVLSSLYYAEGFYALKPRPENAIADFIKAAQIESD